MVYLPLRPRATSWGLLLAGLLLPASVPAAPAQAEGGTALSPASPLAPALMLAKSWQAGLDPAAYLVSEKLDGVRALWDGQVLRFKSGRPIAAPAWFVAALPATPLDGELWLGRHSFDRLSATVRRSVPVDAEWRELRYMVFDLPHGAGAFGERVSRMVSVLARADVPWLKAVEQTRVVDGAALQSQLLKTVDQGGEGLMLHRADAQWQAGRSDALRKLKTTPDEDARVIAQVPGKGRHAGRMGALLLEMPSGQRFALGTGFSDAQRDAPPPVGAVVTYRYRDRTATGLPKFASFLRVREAE
ncbi:MAG: DNA ligase [Rhodoferax sp.]|nr:DNA ligase [Rhodoferax sp.]MDP3653579.1 DNA ligase [Rhodoferax sp.]